MSVVIKKLIWDEWNTAHIARHDVIPDEVEEICRTNSQRMALIIQSQPETQVKKNEEAIKYGAKGVKNQYDNNGTA